MATDRRALLAGLAGLPLAAVALPAFAAPTSDDLALIDMHRRWVALEAFNAGAGDRDVEQQAAQEAAYEADGLQAASVGLCPVTLPGAVATLAWARAEFDRCHVAGRLRYDHKPDQLDVWHLAMLDGALGVLRAAVEGGRA